MTGAGERPFTVAVVQAAPVFLAQHKGCLLFTDEGFKDAVAALPEAHAMSFVENPANASLPSVAGSFTGGGVTTPGGGVCATS